MDRTIALRARIFRHLTMDSLRPTRPTVTGDPAGQLRRLAEEILRISADLDETAPDGPSSPGEGKPASRKPTERDAIIRSLYAARRQRDLIFGTGDIFGEPAWDILLDLYIAEQERKALPVTSACIGAAVPTTTGLRWLNILEKQGLVERSNDPGDARRTFVRLSPKGLRAMNRFVDQFSGMLA